MGPFDRFNDRAKRVLALAQDEAIRFNHNYIGTEHLLLGLIREGEGPAARVLDSMGIELSKVRTALEFIIGRGDAETTPTEITLSPRTKKVIELAIDEARRLGDEHVGTEHLLLGLVREGEGIASGVLESLGISLAVLREQVLKVMGRTDPTGLPTPAAVTAFREYVSSAPRRSLRTAVLAYVVALAPALIAAAAAAVIGAVASLLIRGTIDWALVIAVLAGFVTLGLAMLPANLGRSGRPASWSARVGPWPLGTHIRSTGTWRFAGGATRANQAPAPGSGQVASAPPSAADAGITAAQRGGRRPFDRFSDRAKRALALAQDEAVRANHSYIGTEHLLIGLAREGQSTAFRALSSLGLSIQSLREALRTVVGKGPPGPPPPEITLDPHVKKAIDLANEESTKLGHDFIGTRHLLLGIVIGGEGAAMKMLESLGITAATVHKAVLDDMNKQP